MKAMVNRPLQIQCYGPIKPWISLLLVCHSYFNVHVNKMNYSWWILACPMLKSVMHTTTLPSWGESGEVSLWSMAHTLLQLEALVGWDAWMDVVGLLRRNINENPPSSNTSFSLLKFILPLLLFKICNRYILKFKTSTFLFNLSLNLMH